MVTGGRDLLRRLPPPSPLPKPLHCDKRHSDEERHQQRSQSREKVERSEADRPRDVPFELLEVEAGAVEVWQVVR